MSNPAGEKPETRFAHGAERVMAFLTGLYSFVTGAEARKGEAYVAAARAASELPRLPIVELDPDLQHQMAVQKHIATLMQSDEWTEIGDCIAAWEAELATTPGGTRYHDVAVETALSGLQAIIDDCDRKALEDLRPADVEVSHFVSTHLSDPDHAILALLAARAHILLGQSCRAEYWPPDQHRAAWRKMAHHYVAAGDILSRFDAIANMSPLLGEAHYLQALGTPGGLSRLREIFQDWIDLDPANPKTYATHVPHLLPDRMGSREEILREAEVALDRTEETLGFGGYALFYLPLIQEEPEVRKLIDVELFATAMLDLATRSATQAEANWAAGLLLDEIEQSVDDRAEILNETFAMVALQWLTEIYPRFWSQDAETVQHRIAEFATAAPDLVQSQGTPARLERDMAVAA